ncbi:hypothetical protein GGX14DRAFT_663768 [Mycena pura]|uniref:Uncharacterized protein n=1 Tax=Mycena pura TaxID=153505 RepID=A0AAD7E0W5_9AGAR|nr:hypothetical protein GGX14DRAFT_663768 [Mycena pura]
MAARILWGHGTHYLSNACVAHRGREYAWYTEGSPVAKQNQLIEKVQNRLFRRLGAEYDASKCAVSLQSTRPIEEEAGTRHKEYSAPFDAIVKWLRSFQSATHISSLELNKIDELVKGELSLNTPFLRHLSGIANETPYSANFERFLNSTLAYLALFLRGPSWLLTGVRILQNKMDNVGLKAPFTHFEHVVDTRQSRHRDGTPALNRIFGLLTRMPGTLNFYGICLAVTVAVGRRSEKPSHEVGCYLRVSRLRPVKSFLILQDIRSERRIGTHVDHSLRTLASEFCATVTK